MHYMQIAPACCSAGLCAHVHCVSMQVCISLSINLVYTYVLTFDTVWFNLMHSAEQIGIQNITLIIHGNCKLWPE